MSSITLTAVGDILLKTNDNSDPFYMVRESLSEGNIVFGNLETVLSQSPVRAKKAHVLYEDPEKVRYLKDPGFDVVNVANNQILDLWVEGFHDILNVLEQNLISYVGGGHSKNENRPVIIERNNIKLGFPGYISGRWRVPKEIAINKIQEREVLRDIAQPKKSCDHVIVSLHWGIEHVLYPSPDQIDLGHRLIDEGASVILGHHPDALQGIEEYHGDLIAYSLGNFPFEHKPPFGKPDQSMSQSVNIEIKRVCEYSMIACTINENFASQVAYEREEEDIRKDILQISDSTTNGLENPTWWYKEIVDLYLTGNMKKYEKRIGNETLKPLVECIVWLMTSFCIKCYQGFLRRRTDELNME
ncbi:hypothetical protein RJ53_01595 [Methanocalculus chunghsingensis]|uniref:Capsule synthesis protein CapA domain-containing protein n=1 Tax=Methanocalculus chunghsingensis TaxID=156457 RepID=A0A8J7W5V9_9EURY|nr:CapA family protein [Methanocalculus chunghsingensis]MBR1368256.1 hypothetical protein [Methanocalculus chunghsingensis]